MCYIYTILYLYYMMEVHMGNEVIIPGVGIGPMTDKYDIKILICYLLKSVNMPLSKEQINYIFQNEQFVNYFSFCDALKDLIDSNHISSSKTQFDEIYTLNELGLETAKKLERSLPKSLRDNVVEAAMELLAKIKKERENEVEISPYENGYMVNCVMHDDSFDLLQLGIFAPDTLQADKIKEKFLDDPVKLYRGLIKLLLDSE